MAEDTIVSPHATEAPALPLLGVVARLREIHTDMGGTTCDFLPLTAPGTEIYQDAFSLTFDPPMKAATRLTVGACYSLILTMPPPQFAQSATEIIHARS